MAQSPFQRWSSNSNNHRSGARCPEIGEDTASRIMEVLILVPFRHSATPLTWDNQPLTGRMDNPRIIPHEVDGCGARGSAGLVLLGSTRGSAGTEEGGARLHHRKHAG